MISKTIGFRGTNHFQTHPYIYISPDMVIGKMMVKIVGYPIFRQIHEVMCVVFFKDVDVDQIGLN